MQTWRRGEIVVARLVSELCKTLSCKIECRENYITHVYSLNVVVEANTTQALLG